jgi:glycosyltransferase involved in cell wall biosynthesis
MQWCFAATHFEVGRLTHRLLFIVNETYFFMTHRLPLARAAAAAGWDVHVAAPDDHVWAPEGFSVDAIERAGFKYHRLPLSRRGKNPVEEIRTLVAAWRLLSQIQPDLVHLLTIKPVIYGGLAARIAGTPAVVATITGLGQMFAESGLSGALLRRLVRILYRFAVRHSNTRIIVQNRHDGDVLVGSGIVDRASTRLIRGSGVDLETFRPVAEMAGCPIVILPARLIWEKGVGDFVSAARILRRRGCTARFALVGDTHPSNPRAVPARDIERWVEEGVVEWWGRREDMPGVFAQSAVVCLPTTYGEGVPKVLIEASAAGRPVVASDIPGCREIVSDGENGVLVPAGNIEALAAALQYVLEDPVARTRMGQRGRQIAEAEFGEDQVARQVLDVYSEVAPAAMPA